MKANDNDNGSASRMGTGEIYGPALLAAAIEWRSENPELATATGLLVKELLEEAMKKGHAARIPARIFVMTLAADIASTLGLDFANNGPVPTLGDKRSRFLEGYRGLVFLMDTSAEIVADAHVNAGALDTDAKTAA